MRTNAAPSTEENVYHRKAIVKAGGHPLPCEMCGKSLPLVATIDVEGVKLHVCAGCTKFGRVVEAPAAARPARPSPSPAQGLERRQKRMTEKPVPLESDEEFVPDFGEKVRQARERKRLSLDDLARAVNEKKSLLAKIEASSFFPDPQLARKLEAALGVKLREKVEEVHAGKVGPSGGVTIGDLIKRQAK